MMTVIATDHRSSAETQQNLTEIMRYISKAITDYAGQKYMTCLERTDTIWTDMPDERLWHFY